MNSDKQAGGHGHSFDPDSWRKLESDERKERMDPTILVKAMELTGDETILDIGAGTGYFAREMAPLAKAIIGLDHSSKMLNIFRSREPFDKSNNISQIVGKGESLPIKANSIDVVFHANLLHEIADTHMFHRQIQRTLKPGGRLFLADWRAIPTHGGPPLEHRISEERATQLLEEDDFRSIQKLGIYKDHYVISAISK